MNTTLTLAPAHSLAALLVCAYEPKGGSQPTAVLLYCTMHAVVVAAAASYPKTFGGATNSKV